MKHLLTILIIFSATLFGNVVVGQRIPDGGIYKVHIDHPDLTADAEILPVKAPSKPYPSRWYYWYAHGSISHTQGGYSGHLLQGAYHSFYENGHPMESGNFSAGLKTRTWSAWNTDGVLKQTVTYRYGQRSGAFAVYGADGKIRQEGAYRDDMLEGRVEDHIKPDSTVVTWYRRGNVIQHRPLLKRLNPFKKRPS
jgi:hypothetical protein